MINTITIDAKIEKKIYGNLDDNTFEMVKTLYDVAGRGIQLSLFLKYLRIQSRAYVLCSSKQSAFIKTCLDTYRLEYSCIEGYDHNDYKTTYISEDYKSSSEEVSISQNENAIRVFISYLNCTLSKETCVLSCVSEYPLTQEIYNTIYARSRYVIVYAKNIDISFMHAKKCDILLMNQWESEWKDEKSQDNIIHSLKDSLLQYAHTIVFIMTNHKLLILQNQKTFICGSLLKEDMKSACSQSVLASIASWSEMDKDLHALAKNVLAMQIGSALSKGVLFPSEETLQGIEKKLYIQQYCNTQG